MKLDKTQIRRIYKMVVAKNIHYKDLRHELTDHIASVVEQRWSGIEADFEPVVSTAMAEVNPSKIQRVRMMSSILLPFRALRKTHPLMTTLAFLVSGLIVQFSLGFFNSIGDANKWLGMAFAVMSVLPALVSIIDQRWKPYRMSFFMSAVLGCYFIAYLMRLINNYVLGVYLEHSAWVTSGFYTLGFGMILIAYIAIYQQYQNVKQYAAH